MGFIFLDKNNIFFNQGNSWPNNNSSVFKLGGSNEFSSQNNKLLLQNTYKFSSFN